MFVLSYFLVVCLISYSNFVYVFVCLGVTCQVESNQGNKIVPIAVGAALAGLVVIVLIAYLIGRFRSRRQSYEPLS